MPNGDHHSYPSETDKEVFERVLREKEKYYQESQTQQQQIGELLDQIKTLKEAIRLLKN